MNMNRPFFCRPSVIVTLIVLCYLVTYPALRWHRVLVRAEIYSRGIKQRPLISRVIAGTDIRRHGVGAFKNAIAPVAFWVFTPLRGVEALYWNSR